MIRDSFLGSAEAAATLPRQPSLLPDEPSRPSCTTSPPAASPVNLANQIRLACCRKRSLKFCLIRDKADVA
jgi:hypothetical protein